MLSVNGNIYVYSRKTFRLNFTYKLLRKLYIEKLSYTKSGNLSIKTFRTFSSKKFPGRTQPRRKHQVRWIFYDEISNEVQLITLVENLNLVLNLRKLVLLFCNPSVSHEIIKVLFATFLGSSGFIRFHS